MSIRPKRIAIRAVLLGVFLTGLELASSPHSFSLRVLGTLLTFVFLFFLIDLIRLTPGEMKDKMIQIAYLISCVIGFTLQWWTSSPGLRASGMFLILAASFVSIFLARLKVKNEDYGLFKAPHDIR